jgi:hypothetical protein
VTLGYIVTEAGEVDHNSIYLRRTGRRFGNGQASDDSIREAERRTLTCVYRPGHIAGQHVRVVVQRTFRILAAI